MTSGSFRFEHFILDPGNRRLSRGGMPVELNGRYLDALALMVREQGQLVSKDRFLEEVWRGVPVTDEALTQCIKTLRRQLGDSAASPRFIETVPKYGYRFIAPVERAGAGTDAEAGAAVSPDGHTRPSYGWRDLLLLGAAGTIGGGIAGIFGGLFYGLGGGSQAPQPGMGAASALMVLTSLCILVGLTGGAGVAFGIATSGFASARAWLWSIAGGAIGGLVVGAFAKLLGLDAFNLLLGQSPGDITGAAEGVMLGGAIGLGAWIGGVDASRPALRRGVAAAGLAGAAAGVIIPLLGGRLMGGSLDLLVRQFPGSRLRLDQIGGWFGESGFGPVSQIVTGALEGAVFAICVVGAMIVARRGLGGKL